MTQATTPKDMATLRAESSWKSLAMAPPSPLWHSSVWPESCTHGAGALQCSYTDQQVGVLGGRCHIPLAWPIPLVNNHNIRL
jgi:hypothetical protein